MDNKFQQFQVCSSDNTQFSYWVYSTAQANKNNNSVLVYIHGLVSDISWFKIPEDLPSNTMILFIPRFPRQHVVDMDDWYNNYKLCLNDFYHHFSVKNIHLVANCFGSLSALMWVMRNPETFSTITLVNPPINPKKHWPFVTKLKILLRSNIGPDHMRRVYLEPKDFSRIPSVLRFIENETNSVFYFSDKLYLTTHQMLKWLKQNLFTLPIPTYSIFSSEDPIVDYRKIQKSWYAPVFPEKISFFYSDHYLEFLPQQHFFWKSIFNFQKHYEHNSNSSILSKHVLVTGATGLLGSNLVLYLVHKHFKVRLLVRNITKVNLLLDKILNKIEIVEGALDNLEAIENAMDGIDVVIHAAADLDSWHKKSKLYKTNVEGTKNILMIAHQKHIKQYIHLGTLDVYGKNKHDVICEDSQLFLGRDHLVASQLQAEIFVKKYCTQNNMPFTIIRPGLMYGESSNHHFQTFITKLVYKNVWHWGKRNNIANVVYVQNVVKLIEKCITTETCFYQSYNIVDKDTITLQAFIKDLTSFKINSKIRFKIPLVVMFKFSILKRLFGVRDTRVDIQKSYQLLGKDYYTYPEGLKRTLANLNGG